MKEAVPLLGEGGGGEGCDEGCAARRVKRAEWAGRRARAAGAAAALLLLPALYLLGRPQHRLLPPACYPQPEPSTIITPTHPDFLVWSPACRIPDIDPMGSEAMAYFIPQKYISCSTGPSYTYMQENPEGQNVIYLNETLVNKTRSKGDRVSCCYLDIIRKNDSSQLIKSTCKKINNSVALAESEEFIMTKCTVTANKGRTHEKTHENAFLNVQPTDELKKRLQIFRDTFSSKRAWNVLIVGIDTLSRINLIRAMPKTYKFLKEHDWLDFQGYNKIDDNTYPNLMAILTGRNQSRARKLCDGTGANSPDKCDFMWKEYERLGYITAYAEDDVGIDTFEKPYHKGFTNKPTDHYLRPVYQMMEKNVHKSKGSVYCSGQLTSGELLYQYALNFVEKYENDPFFGFFWANTFSHNDIGSPSSMDEKTADFFESLQNTGTLDNTIVWFISDHGIRYGKMRTLISGYYEERLPAMYVSIPKDFRELHKDEYNNLQLNTKRLTTPYDVFMTLQDILYLSGRKEVLVSSEACPMCQSLFQEVPRDRSCAECSIHPHWCTCNPLRALPSTHEVANRALDFVLEQIEEVLSNVNKKCRKCAKLKLNQIIRLHEYDYIHKSNSSSDFLITFSSKPEMIFEATVKFFNESQTFVTEGIISRLSAYQGTGHCVSTAYLKKFCHCIKKCIK